MKRKTTPPLTGKEKEVKELNLALIAWKKSSERERGLRSTNDNRQHRAERD